MPYGALQPFLLVLIALGFVLFFGSVIWGTVTHAWSHETWTLSLKDCIALLKAGRLDTHHVLMLTLGLGALLITYPTLIWFLVIMFPNYIGVLVPLAALVWITARITIAFRSSGSARNGGHERF